MRATAAAVYATDIKTHCMRIGSSQRGARVMREAAHAPAPSSRRSGAARRYLPCLAVVRARRERHSFRACDSAHRQAALRRTTACSFGNGMIAGIFPGLAELAAIVGMIDAEARRRART
jgi:hypothetical protein